MLMIFKYPLELLPHQGISMPADSQILDLQVQRGVPCLWAIGDPDKPYVSRTFKTFGTGFEVKFSDHRHKWEHVGTYQVEGGQFIYHVFEVTE